MPVARRARAIIGDKSQIVASQLVGPDRQSFKYPSTIRNRQSSIHWVKFVLVSDDQEIVDAAKSAFQRSDKLAVHKEWANALADCRDADLLFVDLLATLKEPHRIAGYEEFAETKMDHPDAYRTPLVLISAPEKYELDFMAGWPDFVFAHLRRPVTEKMFRRASTWV